MNTYTNKKNPTRWHLELGATTLPDGSSRFQVWAPRVRELAVILTDRACSPVPLASGKNGWFEGVIAGVTAGERYRYLLDGKTERPDPASRFQPEGVHGPSQVIDPDRYNWQDTDWRGLALEQYIIYELHVGTFTAEGTFDSAITRLDYLCELGITAVELMPVAQFPGERNWGYDGVFPFAVQNSYGGPDALKRLVDACHTRGLAVIMDVVYNHLGPEGNYLHDYAPYFTNRYCTPWGEAVNFDGPESDPVRGYFISNALYWVTEYHIDALRLDAIHGIYDFSAMHILLELTQTVHIQAGLLGRHVYVIAESDLNDVRVINPAEIGGYGLDAQWNDDFHHCLRTLLTGQLDGYYADFGSFPQLVKAFSEGFVMTGEYSAFRKRRHGSSTSCRPPGQLVVFSQNHDQVGNRMRGERLGAYLSPAQLRLAAAAVLLSPCIPLLFMGEEYAEQAPFPYFVSHGDPELVEAVRRGRREEFAAFVSQDSAPDPQALETFISARLNPEQRLEGEQKAIFNFYRELIRLRRELPSFSRLSREDMSIFSLEDDKVLALTRQAESDTVICLFNFSDEQRSIQPLIEGSRWRMLLNSAADLPADRTGPVAEYPNTIQALDPFGTLVLQKEK